VKISSSSFFLVPFFLLSSTPSLDLYKFIRNWCSGLSKL
jgi:hypothetical protein